MVVIELSEPVVEGGSVDRRSMALSARGGGKGQIHLIRKDLLIIIDEKEEEEE